MLKYAPKGRTTDAHRIEGSQSPSKRSAPEEPQIQQKYRATRKALCLPERRVIGSRNMTTCIKLEKGVSSANARRGKRMLASHGEERIHVH
eukprot:6178139-Pleurochrysis_carterae.AAC.2